MTRELLFWAGGTFYGSKIPVQKIQHPGQQPCVAFQWTEWMCVLEKHYIFTVQNKCVFLHDTKSFKQQQQHYVKDFETRTEWSQEEKKTKHLPGSFEMEMKCRLLPNWGRLLPLETSKEPSSLYSNLWYKDDKNPEHEYSSYYRSNYYNDMLTKQCYCSTPRWVTLCLLETLLKTDVSQREKKAYLISICQNTQHAQTLSHGIKVIGNTTLLI